jgi:hypothetical protein
MSVHLQNNLNKNEAMHRRNRDLEASEMRKVFIKAIKDAGYERPQFHQTLEGITLVLIEI